MAVVIICGGLLPSDGKAESTSSLVIWEVMGPGGDSGGLLRQLGASLP